MIRVFDLPSDENLLPFSAFLWKQKIPHKITEEGGRQVLWLEYAEYQAVVRSHYSEWRSGLLKLEPAKISWRSPAGLLTGPLADWKRIPVTLVLLVSCLVVALLTGLGSNNELVALFSMTEFKVSGSSLYYAPFSTVLEQGQYWRVVTPLFLHFGIFHLLFNMLWVMDFGHRIEIRHKGFILFVLVLFTGISSNVIQFISMDGYPLFGGMSGVIYGLLGFCWVREKEEPGFYQVPSGIYMFMLIWLVIGFTGVLASLGFGQIANAAHAGGLLSGVAAGWLFNRFAR